MESLNDGLPENAPAKERAVLYANAPRNSARMFRVMYLPTATDPAGPALNRARPFRSGKLGGPLVSTALRATCPGSATPSAADQYQGVRLMKSSEGGGLLATAAGLVSAA